MKPAAQKHDAPNRDDCDLTGQTDYIVAHLCR